MVHFIRNMQTAEVKVELEKMTFLPLLNWVIYSPQDVQLWTLNEYECRTNANRLIDAIFFEVN